MNPVQLTEKINQALPQTQCQLCDYPSCRAYAKAITEGEADIDRCHPGGEPVLRALSDITNKPYVPHLEKVQTQFKPPSLVQIDEALCIGCTKCIKACPVDAIIGTNKHMHSIISSECTGCDLCIPACPMDCIISTPKTAAQPDTGYLAERYAQQQQRQAQAQRDKTMRHQANKLTTQQRSTTVAARKAAIQDMLKRVQSKNRNDDGSQES